MTPDKIVHAAVVCVVRRGTAADEVLLTRRPAGSPLAGWWEFPGGKLEPGESPTSAACREVLEETGLILTELAPLTEVVHEYAHAIVHLHGYIGIVAPDTTVSEHLAPGHRWTSVTALNAGELPAANAPLVEALRQALTVRDETGADDGSPRADERLTER